MKKKKSNMEKKKSSNEGWYKAYKASGKCIPFIFLIIILVAFILDLVKETYVSKTVEDLFDYDIQNVLPVTISIWAFITAIIVFSIGKFDEHRYGIRMIDTLIVTFGTPFLIMQGFVVILELLALIIASMYELYILLWVVTLIELITMICGIVMVVFEMSKTMFHITVEKQYQELIKKRNIYESQLNDSEKEEKLDKFNSKEISSLLVKMTYGLDYANEMEKDILLKILKKVTVGKLSVGCVFHLASNIFTYADKNIAHSIFKEWFLHQEISLETRKGIILVFMIESSEEEIWRCLEFFEWIDDVKQRRKLYIWCLVCNRYLQNLQNQEWRSVFCFEIESLLDPTWSEDYEQEAVMDLFILSEISEIGLQQREDAGWVLEYIFKER